MKTKFQLSLACLSLAAATSVMAAGEATNVIFFLGDGMGPTTVTASRIYKYGEDGKLTMESLKRTARIKTYSLDGQTTDSAPSMAAYMTGVKMRNEVISMSPETLPRSSNTSASEYRSGAESTCPATGNGQPVKTLLEYAKAAGKSVGAVTTTSITHATPAATYSHICNRNGENAIAAQLVPGGTGTGAYAFNTALGDGVDVLLGGGTDQFLPAKRADGRDLTAELQAKGYTYVNSGTALSALNTATTTKLLGLFNPYLMAFSVISARLI